MGASWTRAFVIGGSEGIGLAVARRLAERGTELAIFGRSAEKLDAARSSLATVADGAYVGQLDVTDSVGTEEVLARAVAEVGVPDLVVTTAGFARAEWFHQAPLDQVRAMIETNYLGTVHVCHALVPHLVEAGRGTVVTTSSMAGLTGVFGYAGYSASKFAVMGFSEALRRELRPYGIHVATLCPPNTRTPGFDDENRTKPAEVLAAEEKVKTLEPEQVADYLLKSLPRRPNLVIPALDGRLGHAVIRHLPRVAERMLRRRPPEPVSRRTPPGARR